MPTISDLEAELDRLVNKGLLLYYAMVRDLGLLTPKLQKVLKDGETDLPDFGLEYDSWYSVALRVVAQVLPDRLDDFVLQYKDTRRKEISYVTYGISDYLLGLQTSLAGKIIADRKSALAKMERQNAILTSAQAAFKSSLVDLTQVLQADLFDSELEAAAALAKGGFVRGGGAIAGVVLERHLSHVADSHRLTLRKKHPTIGDLNQLLKDHQIIDTPKWRFIQHLGDLRNLCDHNKDREPTKDDVAELVEGVSKIIKTVS